MNAKDILSKLILNQIKLSQALMLTKLYCSKYLSLEQVQWIDSEISGYDNQMQIPDFRLLESSLFIEVYDVFGNLTIQKLDTSHISAYLKEGGYESTSPDKMHVSQGLESLEEICNEVTGSLKMYLNENLKDLILKWYSFPTNIQFGRIYQESNIAYVKNLLTKVKSRLIDILNEITTMENFSVLHEETKQSASNKKKLFISYGWEDEQHNLWVHNLADKLGDYFEVAIDVNQPLGIDVNYFMERMVTISDRVLMILTPIYKKKADARENGVGYESVLISDELYRNQSSITFIPIIRKGEKDSSYPKYMGNRLGLDMTDDTMFAANFKRLVDDIKNNTVSLHN